MYFVTSLGLTNASATVLVYAHTYAGTHTRPAKNIITIL